MAKSHLQRQTKRAAFYKSDLSDEGIVEGLVTVFGVLDEGNDISHPGSFTKTIVERAGKILVCDSHLQDSIMRVLGKPLKLWEVGKDALPPEVKQRYPEATGGLMARVQFLLNTPEGKGAFERIKAGAISEWSYTYDSLQVDYSKVKNKEGHTVTARNLRQLKLYEISPVLWGMNPATVVTAVKASKPAAQGSEEKPWAVFKDGDRWGVYKVDGDGNRTGEALGMHDSEEDANTQLAALHANVDEKEGKADSAEQVVSDIQSEFTAVYGDPNAVQPTYSPWVRATYPDLGYCIVEMGPACYMVPFTQQDGLVTFAPREEWTEGTYDFVPLAKDVPVLEKEPMSMGYMVFKPFGEVKHGDHDQSDHNPHGGGGGGESGGSGGSSVADHTPAMQREVVRDIRRSIRGATGGSTRVHIDSVEHTGSSYRAEIHIDGDRAGTKETADQIANNFLPEVGSPELSSGAAVGGSVGYTLTFSSYDTGGYDEDEESEKSRHKAGRVLSAANVARIRTAMAAMHEALISAGVDMGEHEDEEEKSESVIESEGKTASPKSGAGRAADEAPTDEDLLSSIELGTAELGLLEQ